MIKKIINDWTYQLEAGYPKVDSDYEVLREVLQEMDLLTEVEIERTVAKARGLLEADPTQPIEEFYTEDEFDQALEQYIYPGQEILHTDLLYGSIIGLSAPEQQQVKQILQSDKPALKLENTRYQITGILLTLYNLIMKTVTVTNGEPSELWFSIVFKGKVAGAISGDDDIETDIVITKNNQTVSLKNYKETTFDLGTLPKEASQYIKKFESLAALLTGRDPETGSTSRLDVNAALLELNKESIQSDIDQFLKLNSDVQLITDLQERIRAILHKQLNIKDAEDLDNITKRFCLHIDRFVTSKLNLVDWWGFIIKKKNIIYLRDASIMIKNSTHIKDASGNYLLGPGIANFKGGKLFVNGGPFGISKVWSDKE